MVRLVLVTVLCGFLLAYHPGVELSLQKGSLCVEGEKVVFSCVIQKSAKVVSLCASPDLARDRGYLQYRFGLPGKLELEYPHNKESSTQAFKYNHYFRAQVDLTEISFSKDNFQYTVFDDYNGEEKPAIKRQGVTVTPSGSDKEKTLLCQGRAKIEFLGLDEILPQNSQ
jgi:hypothetical protein